MENVRRIYRTTAIRKTFNDYFFPLPPPFFSLSPSYTRLRRRGRAVMATPNSLFFGGAKKNRTRNSNTDAMPVQRIQENRLYRKTLFAQ